MQFQYSHRRDEKEAIFFSAENGQTAAIPKGSFCVWDITDNSAVSGITANTRGTRVIICPTAEAGDATAGVVRKAGFAHTAMDGTPANTRGTQSYLIQVYGWRNDVIVDTDAASNIIAGGLIVPSGDAAGAVEGPQDVTSPTVAELSKIVGTAMDAVAINNVGTIEAIVNCLR
jgi:hypothetical protein